MDEQTIRDRLDATALDLDVGDPSSMLGGVRGRVRSRRRRRAALAGLGVSVLLVGGIATVVTDEDSPGDELIRSATPSTVAPATTVAPVATDDAPPAADDVAPEGDPAADGVVAAERVELPVRAPEEGRFIEWLVPWKDGFLAGGNVTPPQSLPGELPAEITELFPPEVVELFADGLPPTIEEATTMLSDAGLLDVVTEIVTANSDAYDAIFAEPTAPAEPFVEFSVDGETWEPIEVTLPDGATALRDVQVVGDRLVSVSSRPALDRFAVSVASTTDLVTWEVQEFEVAETTGRPSGVAVDVYIWSFAANEAGWVVGASVNTHVDIEQFLPAEVVAEMNASGSGFSVDDEGIAVDIYPPDGGDPTTYRFTWADLDVPEDVLPYLTGSNVRFEVWTARFGETPQQGDLDPSYPAEFVATPDGFLAIGFGPDSWSVSTDGMTWTPVEVPFDDREIIGGAATDEGLLLYTHDGFGTGAAWLGDPARGDWRQLEVPDGAPLGSSVVGAYVAPPVLVVDASDSDSSDFGFTIEKDGLRLTMTTSGPNQSYELVEIESGALLASEAIDLRFADVTETGLWEQLQYRTDGSGFVIVDPASGETLVDVTDEELRQAVDASISGGREFERYAPDLWVVAYVGDDRWLVDDLDDGDPSGFAGPLAGAINGDTLLVGSGFGWLRYDLAE